jgi:hypothetical protein
MSQTPASWPQGAPTDAPPIPIAGTEVEVRFDYLKQVYGLLLAGIAGFVAIETVLFTTGIADAIAEFVFGTTWLLVLGGFMLVSWLANRLAFSARDRSTALAGYALLVLAQSIVFVPLLWIARESAPGVIGQAAGVTLVGFVGLSGVAMTSARDFSFLGSMLKWVGVGALLLIVSAVVFGLSLGTWFSVAMIVFAGGAILYDTQKILRSWPVGTEVQAAMQLFSSVALLFWYVLRLFMSRD